MSKESDRQVKLIVSDIDGTLLPEGTSYINPEFYELIRKMHEKNAIFVAASGRDLNSIGSVFDPVKDDIILMANNGAQIVCQGQELYAKYLTKETCDKAVDYARKTGKIHVLMQSSTTAYTDAKDPEWLAWLDQGYGLEIMKVPDLKEVKASIVKISLFCVGVDASYYADDAIKNMSEYASIMVAGEHWIDFVAPGVSKGAGLAQLQRRMGINVSETIAFGDNFNDIPMLQSAGNSYAVASARDAVKEAAMHVLPQEEEAVIREIKRILEQE